MKTAETLLWITGTTLMVLCAVALSGEEHLRQQGVASFAQAQENAATLPPLATPTTASTAKSPRPAENAVIAILRIPVIELEVPVYRGTEAHTLLRGAGLVEGTSSPGSHGNVGIAAHRDSHFRDLKDVAIGDLVELGTLDQTQLYKITDLSVVDPDAVHVLDETGESVLTLVTCYPFYFVGNAPRRYIVRATAVSGYM